ncbi:uncharacterized protein DEA37_0011858 [Paragonimus westermani]|uniref:Uncharacterized protein n=1 Tax=Paragonimus westermani TaxID=34504 RepID=A0A5J4NND1_9TREM|nr:uncharacterized protein DEA37_0011858 [Paragonimus westermani]
MDRHRLTFMNFVLFWVRSNITHILFRASLNVLLPCLICYPSTISLGPLSMKKRSVLYSVIFKLLLF